ncbi:MAG: hypothetical protein OI74_12270 [Gammaproteobacteria bacterium (ex Lamellibrachia satsuma)]|nr:MAG: D-glycero-beta-D-manno-heptose 1,7-bisphosphate 7-phosphatase [Gammaproteobacteria bacterium (ex Lamellibrachia satsuma)]RRS32108.1 MAG: hypothetical protein OI74_12270 [Gammaproteobacteria bacterium (ex Lamellibrachia satsuma)]RRS34297.1 MAG: hypothetical protein NV67_13500 [Gammaproteobacteria bacterium (ex Lamellibrachia satsuma)]
MKIIILDRDGVINEDSDDFIKSPDEWIPLPGSLEAIARLNHAGFRVFVATNQSGVSRGYFSIDTLNKMHNKMQTLLQKHGGHIDGIFFCPHGPDDNCDCRKPKPGLYQQISQRSRAPLHQVPIIGDSLRDLQAAIIVGANPILVRTGKGNKTLSSCPDELRDIPIYQNLSEAVDALLT